MIKNIRGIEGDDIPYHLSLLGYNADTMISDRYYFFPLNDHYNTHGPTWLTKTVEIAKTKEVVVFYDLVNTGDHEHNRFKQFIWNFDHPNKVYLTVNQSPKFDMGPRVKIVQWDFMWNRIKAYYTEQVPGERLHLHHYSASKYNLFDLDFVKSRNKIFLSLLGREYGFRKALYDQVIVHKDKGYVSNRSRGITLEDHRVMGAFNPVPNTFYQDSYFSIYVESNCTQQDLLHLTEKTFEPLFKGHFILPFTNPDAITRLETMGFEFPSFIDYASINTTLDYDNRFACLLTAFKTLIDTPIDTIQDMYYDSRHLLQHNQDCLHSIPYDRRILEVFDV